MITTRFAAAGGHGFLQARVWAAASPRAGLLLVHGLGEHSGRYATLAQLLAEDGISTFAWDLRGHGRSTGQRGHVSRFGQLLADVDQARNAAEAHLEGLRLFVMGHSLGGLVALRWLQTRRPPLLGAILSAPLLELGMDPPRWKTALSGVLSRWLPALPFSNEIDAAALSRDPAYVRSYREDPLVHDRITPRMYTEMMAAARAAAAERFPDLPVLVLVPGADRVVQPEATLRLTSGLAGDVTVRHYPDARHEAFNDIGRDAVLADIRGWIALRC